jgi:hypothetical protein
MSPFLTEAVVTTPNEEGSTGRTWARLLEDAARLQLPTKFLKALPPDFIDFEFDDLRTYAAEYHPGEHRMLLNRTLSFNAAGRALKPLSKMTHKELEVLYHELFHAYMDYLTVLEAQSGETARRPEELLRFAREQQVCRYGEVVITPIVQRTGETESRYLTQAESWEALNETWAVFVGWAVWNQLELQHKTGRSMLHERGSAQQWIHRFKAALEKGDFRGYYVPEDLEERRVTRKRFLAKPSQLTVKEAMVLMEQVFGFSNDFTKLVHASAGQAGRLTCSTTKERVN